ncbi:MAG: Fur family transcriptional regulator [Pseudomonadota bacterium]
MTLLDRARAAGVKITHQRRLVCDALDESDDHPDVDVLLERARVGDPKLSLSSVYRTIRALEEHRLVTRHDFGDGRARYEVNDSQHHDHLIDLDSGKILEFNDPELETLKRRIARRLGYRLEFHSLELYGRARNG